MKCKLGLCVTQRCAAHKWTYNHEDWYLFFQVMAVVVVIVAIVVFATIANHEASQPIRNNITGFNCGQLEEYIADRSSQYSYAVHRHKWLCQI